MERRTYGDPCGVARALDAVGERWALLVVRELLLGPKRFSALHRGLGAASQNVLAQRLRELEAAGIVRRRRLGPPAGSWVYELTEQGSELEPVLIALGQLGPQPADDSRGRAERRRARAGPEDDLRPGRRRRPRGVARPARGRRPARARGDRRTPGHHAREREGPGRHAADRRADPARARLPQAAPGRCGGGGRRRDRRATSRRCSACWTRSRPRTTRAGAPRAPRGWAGGPCTSR